MNLVVSKRVGFAVAIMGKFEGQDILTKERLSESSRGDKILLTRPTV